jgi:hypothetical protein
MEPDPVTPGDAAQPDSDEAPAAAAGGLDPLAQQLAALGHSLEQAKDLLHALLERAGDSRQASDRLGAKVSAFQEFVRTHLIERAEHADAQDSAQAAPAGELSARWEEAILGAELARDPRLEIPRRGLLAGLFDGDSAACAMIGHLLIFRAAPADRLPQLLRDVGEAYYRWQPKRAARTSPMEAALVQWLRGQCEAAEIPNTIELVNPGERFDTTRHSATTRGVEVTEVHGWIVLRDNGKVYTKATVAVR